MKQDGLHWWASSYSNVEKLKYLRDRILLPNKRNKIQFPDIQSRNIKLQSELINPVSIGFTGDLMPAINRKITLSPDLEEYMNGIDILIINLEGIISDKKRYLALAHNTAILDFVNSLAKQKKVLINVANNHAGDFGSVEFYQSVQKIESYGFEVFGYKEKPYSEIGKFRFYSASYWSNQKFNEINRFNFDKTDRIKSFINSDKINIFIPHWGYEMQLYPSENQVKFAEKILNDWDVIAGNHTHCPQPCVHLKINNKDKLIAYSLGNFIYSHYNTNHYFGALLKLTYNQNDIKPLLAEYDFKITQMIPVASKIQLGFGHSLQYKKLRTDKVLKLFRLKSLE